MIGKKVLVEQELHDRTGAKLDFLTHLLERARDPGTDHDAAVLAATQSLELGILFLRSIAPDAEAAALADEIQELLDLYKGIPERRLRKHFALQVPAADEYMPIAVLHAVPGYIQHGNTDLAVSSGSYTIAETIFDEEEIGVALLTNHVALLYHDVPRIVVRVAGYHVIRSGEEIWIHGLCIWTENMYSCIRALNGFSKSQVAERIRFGTQLLLRCRRQQDQTNGFVYTNDVYVI